MLEFILVILAALGLTILTLAACFLPVPFIYLRYFIKHCYEYYQEKPSYIKTVGDLIHHSHEISKIWIDDFNVMPLVSHIALIIYIIHDLFKFICWLIPKICHYIYVIGDKLYINKVFKLVWNILKYLYKFLYICCKPIRIIRDKIINYKNKIYEIKLQ